MEIIKIDANNPDPKIIKQAVDALILSGAIIYPTDTAYGLGVNALDEKVIRKLYQIKGRDFAKPTHVVVRDWEMINQLCHTNKAAKILYDKFLPGPLTIILPKKMCVSDLLTGYLPTLGIRIPDSPITKLLSKLSPFPYTTPSANPSGGLTPHTINQSLDQFSDLQKSLIDLVLDAGQLAKVDPSTIVDCSVEIPKIIRPGPISKERIEKALGVEVQ
ncbi:threonylcarbamoyl-AMP synthase [Candidatus Microgenomates bacterium]|nr:threonylcarbamoyl-AMP synthase [Candidatus Microgenomates bacterium]